jgi:hypothetical protein
VDEPLTLDAIADDDRQVAVLRWLHDNAPVAEDVVARRVRSSPVEELDTTELLRVYERLGLLTRFARSDGPYVDTTATVEPVVARPSSGHSDDDGSVGEVRTDRWARELR